MDGKDTEIKQSLCQRLNSFVNHNSQKKTRNMSVFKKVFVKQKMED